MKVPICLADVLVNVMAVAAIGIVAYLCWTFASELLERRRRRRDRERRDGKP